MKKLRSLQGGYPRQQDYLLSLQTELFDLSESLFASLGVDMVLNGCTVVNNGNGTVNISAGIVYVSGEVCRFGGANNVLSDLSKTFVKDAPANTDPKLFADGQSRPVYTEVKVIIGNKSNNTQIPIGVDKLYNLSSYIEDVVSSYAIKGEIKDIYDLDGDFLTNFDASGLGITPRYNNWALFNGNNGGPNGQGRVRITAGKIVNNGVEYTYLHGLSGGEVNHKLTVAELPTFRMNYKGWGPYQGNKNGDNNGPDHDNQDFKWVTMQSDPVGSDVPHNNMQPHVNVYTIIKIA